MKRRIAAYALLALTLLSLPLCCLALMTVVPNPLFRGAFTIANQSSETLHVTPIGEAYGERHVLVENFSRFPYLPLLQPADIRVDPGESVRITCDIDEDSRFSEIVVRNSHGEYRQLTIDQPTINLAAYPSYDGHSAELTYVIESFTALSPVVPAALAVAQKAGGINLGAWGAVLLGLVPVGLFLAWLRAAGKRIPS